MHLSVAAAVIQLQFLDSLRIHGFYICNGAIGAEACSVSQLRYGGGMRRLHLESHYSSPCREGGENGN